ncbi:MAG: DUF4870 domain-containing protein [Acidimicrobiia bacterium]|nr:DUF4870 domain-containing protein [Acidimicrobiia bacterium]
MNMQPPSGGQEIAPKARTWASLAHLIPLVGFGVLGPVAPLVIYLLKKDVDPFIAHHSREALNFQLTVLTGVLVALASVQLTGYVGIALLVVVGVFFAVFALLGGIAAMRGERYRYPVNMRLVTGG